MKISSYFWIWDASNCKFFQNLTHRFNMAFLLFEEEYSLMYVNNFLVTITKLKYTLSKISHSLI